jgi:hypothetical protein
MIGLLSVVAGLLGQVVVVWLADLISVLAYAIAGQWKSIPSLAVSHYWYHKPKWTLRQIFAFLLVGGAALMFAWSSGSEPEDGAQIHEEESREEAEEQRPEFSLLPRASDTEFDDSNA